MVVPLGLEAVEAEVLEVEALALELLADAPPGGPKTPP